MTTTETPEISPGTASEAVPKKRQKLAAAKARESRKPAKKPTESRNPRSGSKGAKVLEMIGRAKGATLLELTKATHWQAHSVRGFLSTAPKKFGVKIDSTKSGSGQRSYRIAK